MRRKRIESLSRALSPYKKSGKKRVEKSKLIKKDKKKIVKKSKKKISAVKTRPTVIKKSKPKKKIKKQRENWDKYRSTRVTHMGKDYSNLLSKDDSNIERLKENKLPLIVNELDLCTVFDIELSEIKWHAYHQDITQTSHYYRFEIPKKDGSMRSIWAPKEYLKRLQYEIKEKILDKISLPDQCFGFVKNRSIVNNASSHLGSAIVINLDIEDFFFSINFFRVTGMFRSLGYSGKIASILTMICTEAPRKVITVKEKNYYISTGVRTLPQGAPTSPVISNIICRKLDKRMAGLARYYNLSYSRYADDISISADDHISLSDIMYKIISIITSEDFKIKRSKLRILRNNNRQEVTGLTINDDLNVSRKWRHLLRSEIDKLRYIDERPDIEVFQHIQRVHGKLMFYKMVNPDRAVKYQDMFDLVMETLPEKFHK